jgi:hypothetical protein
MLKTEIVRFHNKEYVRTWSDLSVMIERDGVLYEEAIDPAELGRTYTETEQEIPPREATEADYLTALERFGVK